MYQEKSLSMVKVGIVGSGRVACRFPVEASMVNNILIQGVYNPNIDHASEFAAKYSLPYVDHYYDSFLEKVDAVYIASPHETHYGYARQALTMGKHVLCEKPLVFSSTEANELFDIANENNLVLMEAIKTAYCPGFNALINTVKCGTIGEVVDVEAAFSRITQLGVRENTDQKYGGAFTWYGSYTLLPIVRLLGTEPESIHFDSIWGADGIDLYTKVNILYKDGFGLSKTGVRVKTEGQLVIAGTKGYILAKSPWWMTKEFEVRYEDPNKVEHFSYEFDGYGLRYEIFEFVNRILNQNECRNDITSQKESIWMSKVYEAFFGYKSSVEVK